MVWFSGAALTAVVCASGFAAYRSSLVPVAQHLSLSASGAEEGGGQQQQGERPKLIPLPSEKRSSDPVDAMSLPMSSEHQSLSKEYLALSRWTKMLSKGDKTKNFDYLLKNGPLTPPRVHSHSTDGVKPDTKIGGMHIMRSASQIMAAKGMQVSGSSSQGHAHAATKAGSAASPPAASEPGEMYKPPSDDVSKEEAIEKKEKAIEAKMNKLEEAY
jgi:hypothetical protein